MAQQMKQHYRTTVEYQLKGKKHSLYTCGTCKVAWPCSGILLEIRENAITQGEIKESNFTKH